MKICQTGLVSVVLSIEELKAISYALEDHEYGTVDRMDPLELKLKGTIDQLLKELGE